MVAEGRRRGATSTAIVIALALALGACGEGGDDDRSLAASASDQGVQLSDPINLADCTDWKRGSVEERVGTIAAIRDFTGGHVAGSQASGTVLPDDRAYDLFENYCENEFARGFKLYKLYGRAAAFSGENAQR